MTERLAEAEALLASLEWSGMHITMRWGELDEESCCPCCDMAARKRQHHPACRLARFLRPQAEATEGKP